VLLFVSDFECYILKGFRKHRKSLWSSVFPSWISLNAVVVVKCISNTDYVLTLLLFGCCLLLRISPSKCNASQRACSICR